MNALIITGLRVQHLKVENNNTYKNIKICYLEFLNATHFMLNEVSKLL